MMSLNPWFDDSNFRRLPSRWGPLRGHENYMRFPRNLWLLEETNSLKSALQNTGASVNFDEDKFQANVDVQQFKPEEISVRVNEDNTVTIEGKHEEKQDEHGYISRHFIRKFVLPENCDIKKIRSKLSSDGVLTILAPKVGDKKIEYREIPITHTGQPVKRVDQASSEDPKK